MNWFYVENGQQAGPVDDAQLDALVRSGRVVGETLVWHEGMAEWKPYNTVAPAAATIAAPPPPTTGQGQEPGTVICSECGRSFPPSEVIRHGNKYICATCKPIFFQRLTEGAASTSTFAPGTATETDLLARDYEVDIGGAMTTSWELFKANAGIMIGVLILVGLLLYAAAIVVSLVTAGLVAGLRMRFLSPFLNLVTVLVTAPLTAGLWNFFVKKTRGEDAGINDAFSGFGPNYWNIVMVKLVPGVLSGVYVAVLVALGLSGFWPKMPTSQFGTQPFSGFNFPAITGPLLICGFIGFLVAVYLGTCWIFALPLTIDKRLKFWPALELSRKMVSKHWWMTLGLFLISSIVSFIGVIACCVGALVTAPVGFGMLTVHYNKVFGDLAVRQD
jgi:hypothetical protein